MIGLLATVGLRIQIISLALISQINSILPQKNCSFTIIPISEGTRGIADNYKSIISHSSYTPLILPPFFKTDLTAGLVLF
jgi:hypothetical protein